jgi:hypothetical protein
MPQAILVSDWSISKNLLLVFSNKLEAQWAEPVSLTFHSALRKLHRTYRTFHRCFPPSFGSFGKAVSEKKIYRNRPMRNRTFRKNRSDI